MLPDWLPLDAWAGFCEMRRAMKRVPFTERAMRLTIRELERLRMEGYDPAAVLDQSTQRGWRGVFPVYGKEAKPAKAEPQGDPKFISLVNTAIEISERTGRKADDVLRELRGEKGLLQ